MASVNLQVENVHGNITDFSTSQASEEAIPVAALSLQQKPPLTLEDLSTSQIGDNSPLQTASVIFKWSKSKQSRWTPYGYFPSQFQLNDVPHDRFSFHDKGNRQISPRTIGAMKHNFNATINKYKDLLSSRCQCYFIQTYGSVSRRIVCRFCREHLDTAKKDNQTLLSAVQLNNVDLVKQLLARGASPNSCDDPKGYVLHLAASNGYAEIVELLLQFGADPNRRDCIGNTALHLAVCSNNLKIVHLLLKAGIDVSSSNLFGRSPLELAQSKLKILQKSTCLRYQEDMNDIKNQVIEVIEVLLCFINKNKNATSVDLDFFTEFQNKFKISETPEEVETDIKDLLTTLDNLSLSGPSSSKF